MRCAGAVAYGDIGVVGPLARGAEDLEIALTAMAGPDSIDGRGWTLNLPRSKKTKLRDFKVAVLLTDPNAEVDDSVQEQISKLASFLAKNKVKVSDKARPEIDTVELSDVYIRLLRAATSARMSDEVYEQAVKDAASLPGDDMSYFAQMQRGNSLPHRTWLQLNEKRHKMRWAWDAFFQDYDLMLCPVAVTAAFPHDQAGPAPQAYDRREQQAGAGGRPDFLGGLLGRHLAALDGRPDWPEQGGPADRRADHRPPVRRLRIHPVRQAAGEGISRLRAAAGL